MRDEHVPIDREDVVVGLPRAGIIRVVEPRLDHGVPAGDRLAERIERVADVGAEQIPDRHRIVEPPRVHVALEPRAEAGTIHRSPPGGSVVRRR